MLKCLKDDCDGRLEARGKVYFNVEDGAYEDGILAVTELDFSPLNDLYDGHPVAIYDELRVSCSACGTEVPAKLGNVANERFERQVVGGAE